MMRTLAAVCVMALLAGVSAGADLPSIAEQAPNTWVKRSPLPDGPPSPRLGYESSMGYVPGAGKLVRWGGHDPGGGGPQLSETWTYDLNAGTWQFLTPNNNPPGNCCCRENATDPTTGLFYRFSQPAFGHGWMWDRARWLREDSVWTFNPAGNKWTNMRPGREPHLNVGKPVFYDPNNGIFWVYDTKLRVYDPYTNTWHVVNESTSQPDLPRAIGKRTYAGMALHTRANKIVLFGDHYQSDPRTLVYDIAADKWIDMKPKTSPPWDRTCPTMVYDSANNIMICVMLGTRWDVDDWAKKIADDPKSTPEQKASAEAERGKKHLETWTYQLETNTWTKLDVAGGPDYFGTRDRLMLYIPELNIVALESRSDKEQQVWTYRYNIAPPAGPVLPAKPIKALPDLKHEGRPRLVIDSRVDVLAANKIVYSWTKSPEPDVVGYVVERAVVIPISVAQKVQTVKQYVGKAPLEAMAEKAIIGNFVRLTDKPIPAQPGAAVPQVTDNVDLTKKVQPDGRLWSALFSARTKGGPASRPEDDKNFDMTQPGCPFAIYAYRVRAVNRLGVESGPSPYQLTVPNEVEQLFTKEDGKDAVIRWQASPHVGVAGYLIFRVDGQYDKTVLLTPEPIKETTFTDKSADGKSHRYYVVAVDAIGQHGLPSHGGWAFRPWGQIYGQFYAKDGWHQ